MSRIFRRATPRTPSTGALDAITAADLRDRGGRKPASWPRTIAQEKSTEHWRFDATAD